GREIDDVIQDKTTEDAVECAGIEGKRLRDIVFYESDQVCSSFGSGLSEHARGEVQSGHLAAKLRELDRVSSCSATNIQDGQPRDVAEHPCNVRFLEDDERVAVFLVDLRPTVVAFLGGQNDHFVFLHYSPRTGDVDLPWILFS